VVVDALSRKYKIVSNEQEANMVVDALSRKYKTVSNEQEVWDKKELLELRKINIKIEARLEDSLIAQSKV
jgi:hypothetical protein